MFAQVTFQVHSQWTLYPRVLLHGGPPRMDK